MAFPDLKPTSRSVTLGDWPVKSYRAQNGKELRLLYGDKRTGAELELSYENISDGDAASFLTHYDEVKGTYIIFDIEPNTRAGSTNSAPLNAPPSNRYRYAGPPQISSVRPGRSTVTVRLVSVFQQ